MSNDATPPPEIRLSRRILRHPPAVASLGVFILITLACWLLPLLGTHDPNETRLSLGATAPFAEIFQLRPTDESAAVFLIDRSRAEQLMRNGSRAMGPVSSPTLTNGQLISWIEIPPILQTVHGDPVRPVWILPEKSELFFENLASTLEGGLDSLPGPPAQFVRDYTVEESSLVFPAGTDELGRDLLARTLVGGRLSIAVGIAATLVSVTIGILYGGIAGYAGGKVDSVMMRFVDILYALPFLIFVILLMVVFPQSLLLLFLAIGAVEWLTTARIVRGEVLSLKRLPFVEAAHCLGMSHGKILCRHILPNTLPPVIVYATLTVPTVILLESVLSFLGLGVQPPNSSWGVLLNEGAERMQTFPWMLVVPASLFALTLLSLNFLGDSLRDLLDPKSRR